MDPLHTLEAERVALLSERAALTARLRVVDRDLAQTEAEIVAVTEAVAGTVRAVELAVAAELTRPSEPIRRLVSMCSSSAADDLLLRWPPVPLPPAGPRWGLRRGAMLASSSWGR